MPAVIGECHVSQRERSGARAQRGLPCGVGYVAVISSPSRLNSLCMPIGRHVYAEVNDRGGGVYGMYDASNPTVLAIRIPSVCRPHKYRRGNVRTGSWQADVLGQNLHAHELRALPGRIVIPDCTQCVVIPGPGSLCAATPAWTEKDRYRSCAYRHQFCFLHAALLVDLAIGVSIREHVFVLEKPTSPAQANTFESETCHRPKRRIASRRAGSAGTSESRRKHPQDVLPRINSADHSLLLRARHGAR